MYSTSAPAPRRLDSSVGSTLRIANASVTGFTRESVKIDSVHCRSWLAIRSSGLGEAVLAARSHHALTGGSSMSGSSSSVREIAKGRVSAKVLRQGIAPLCLRSIGWPSPGVAWGEIGLAEHGRQLQSDLHFSGQLLERCQGGITSAERSVALLAPWCCHARAASKPHPHYDRATLDEARWQ